MALATRHRIGAVILLVISSLAIVVPAVASPSDEAAFVDLMNASRSASGLATLSTYADLVDDARRHTGDMIAENRIFHSSEAELMSVTTGWSTIGENVGMGPNPEILHQAFMASPSHKANVLGDYDRVGVGVDRSADGTMFVTVIFMKSDVVPATTTTTAPPPPPTTAPPAPPATVPAVAPPPDATSPSLLEVAATPPAEPAPVSEPAPGPVWSGVDSTSWVEDLVLGRSFCISVSAVGSVCAE